MIKPGRYLGTPVLVVADHGDGYVTALWPDRLNPGRSHGQPRPFTFLKGEWWLHWRDQIEQGKFAYEPPPFPLHLKPKMSEDEA